MTQRFDDEEMSLQEKADLRSRRRTARPQKKGTKHAVRDEQAKILCAIQPLDGSSAPILPYYPFDLVPDSPLSCTQVATSSSCQGYDRVTVNSAM